jgi:hypothetical protein
MQCDVSLPVFLGNLLPPSSEYGSSETLVMIYLDGSFRFLLNTGNDLPDYMAS